MIKIKYNPNTLRVTASGHAGGKAGYDIVCAGVSTVIYNLANVINIYPEDRLKKPSEIVLEDGKAIIQAFPKKAYREVIAHDFSYAYIGLAMLQEEYPEKITLEVIPRK